MPKLVRTNLALDWKLYKAKNTIIWTFNLVPKKNLQLFSLDQITNNKTFDLVKNNLALDQMHYFNFRSSEKWKIIRSSENETLDLVKKETFDLVKFDLPTPSPQKEHILFSKIK